MFRWLLACLLVRSTLGAVEPFPLNQVSIAEGRFYENQDRTLSYLKFIDPERLLYNFRATHQLDTKGATALGGWDAPDFPFRSHVQGHFLSAWAQCYATLGDEDCRDRAVYVVAELARCQANNEAAGFTAGYLSGFPESDIVDLEQGKLDSGNVPYYCLHKTLAGLLDVWRLIGDETARDVLLAFAGWVDTRTAALDAPTMQTVLDTEFGGMNDVLAALHDATDDARWLDVARRFDHAAIFDPLAANRDELDGLHANTQIPKWIGALAEYHASGDDRYRDIAQHAWDITVSAHTYAIGANSQAEHFRAPNAIAKYLNNDTAEACNSYNMLKLTRALWALDPHNATYFDFYESVLLNHLLGQQNPADPHGHITYFTSLNPGGERGIGPAWGGGTWSTDHDSFWCCQGTALETNTKFSDSIYFSEESILYVNQFIPSELNWAEQGIRLNQATTFPTNDSTTLTIQALLGSSSSTRRRAEAPEFELHIRIPSWTTNPALTLNGKPLDDPLTPGQYAVVPARTWQPDDTVSVRAPMALRTIPTPDDPALVAVAYGPTVLCGNYGDEALQGAPVLQLDTLARDTSGELAFVGQADGQEVKLGPCYDAQGFGYVVYWRGEGELK